MTAQERDLLKDLLETRPENVENVLDRVYHEHAVAADALTPSSERALLRAAEAVGPVTLSADEPSEHNTMTPQSAIEDIGGFVKRYPLVAVGAVAGVAYLLTRRRK